jgi:hypothetical protein
MEQRHFKRRNLREDGRNRNSGDITVERNHQNRYYHANEDSDIYESEFQNEDEIYDDEAYHEGRRENNIDNDGDYGYQHRDGFESDYNPPLRDTVDREAYEHQRSRYVSKNPNRYRKPSKRRRNREVRSLRSRRNHYIMQNFRIGAQR